MKILVIDGQGGGLGRALVTQLLKALPDQTIMAVGTNALATSAMLRAGAHLGATGENAVIHNCRDADLILGAARILVANAMLGEVTPAMAAAASMCWPRAFWGRGTKRIRERRWIPPLFSAWALAC